MKKLSELKTPHERRVFLKQNRDVEINHLKEVLVDDEKTIHCENLIGAISVPLGIAGPVSIDGLGIAGEYFIPLATTEGALVASISRGCKAISLSGGAQTNMHKVGATRGPVFHTGSLKNGRKLYDFIKNNQKKLANVSEKTSRHLKFKKVDVRTVADYAFMRFYFDTDEAMGMNMVTIATQAICDFIEQKTDAICISVAGNYDIDKKPAWLNFINNRGYKVWAEATLPKKVVRSVLKTTPEKLYETWFAKCMLGSAMSGSLGFNAHFANTVAAFFAATGQDLAHTVEGSMGITTTKVLAHGDLYSSIYMPSIMIGTVGGGTKLKTQTEARNIIGVTSSAKLAQVLGAAVLAGELSLLASQSDGSLGAAHKRLGR